MPNVNIGINHIRCCTLTGRRMIIECKSSVVDCCYQWGSLGRYMLGSILLYCNTRLVDIHIRSDKSNLSDRCIWCFQSIITTYSSRLHALEFPCHYHILLFRIKDEPATVVLLDTPCPSLNCIINKCFTILKYIFL